MSTKGEQRLDEEGGFVRQSQERQHFGHACFVEVPNHVQQQIQGGSFGRNTFVFVFVFISIEALKRSVVCVEERNLPCPFSRHLRSVGSLVYNAVGTTMHLSRKLHGGGFLFIRDTTTRNRHMVAYRPNIQAVGCGTTCLFDALDVPNEVQRLSLGAETASTCDKVCLGAPFPFASLPPDSTKRQISLELVSPIRKRAPDPEVVNSINPYQHQTFKFGRIPI
mmetsp:Transcript_19549/g.28926  ORF Transcript_19549/g.28926 Transcript_19549/m.28926 type:complete len:222 (-) Transcript_19549:301-966(-)